MREGPRHAQQGGGVWQWIMGAGRAMLDKLKEFDRMIRDKSWFTQGFIFLALMAIVLFGALAFAHNIMYELAGEPSALCDALINLHDQRVGEGCARNALDAARLSSAYVTLSAVPATLRRSRGFLNYTHEDYSCGSDLCATEKFSCTGACIDYAVCAYAHLNTTTTELLHNARNELHELMLEDPPRAHRDILVESLVNKTRIFQSRVQADPARMLFIWTNSILTGSDRIDVRPLASALGPCISSQLAGDLLKQWRPIMFNIWLLLLLCVGLLPPYILRRDVIIPIVFVCSFSIIRLILYRAAATSSNIDPELFVELISIIGPRVTLFARFVLEMIRFFPR